MTKTANKEPEDGIDRFFNGLSKVLAKAQKWAEEQNAAMTEGLHTEGKRPANPDTPVDSDIFERPAQKSSRFVHGEPVWILDGNTAMPKEEHFVRTRDGVLWEPDKHSVLTNSYVSAGRGQKASTDQLRHRGITHIYIRHRVEES